MEASANAGRSGRSLQDLAAGMFSLILSLRTSGSYGEEAALRQRIADFLAGIEREGFAAGFSREDVDAVKFPLVAFIDEVILYSEWEHREAWRDRPLQLDLFNERTAGTRFFEYLARLRQAGGAKRDLLEVYHLCLLLGFEGKYRIMGGEELRRLTAELARELGYGGGQTREIRLGPHGKRRDNPVAGRPEAALNWRVAAIAAGAVVVLFVVFTLWLNGARSGALEALPLPL